MIKNDSGRGKDADDDEELWIVRDVAKHDGGEDTVCIIATFGVILVRGDTPSRGGLCQICGNASLM